MASTDDQLKQLKDMMANMQKVMANLEAERKAAEEEKRVETAAAAAAGAATMVARRAEEEAARLTAEEEAARLTAEEEARRQAAQEEAARKAAEEAAYKAEKEEVVRKAIEVEATRKALEVEEYSLIAETWKAGAAAVMPGRGMKVAGGRESPEVDPEKDRMYTRSHSPVGLFPSMNGVALQACYNTNLKVLEDYKNKVAHLEKTISEQNTKINELQKTNTHHEGAIRYLSETNGGLLKQIEESEETIRRMLSHTEQADSELACANMKTTVANNKAFLAETSNKLIFNNLRVQAREQGAQNGAALERELAEQQINGLLQFWHASNAPGVSDVSPSAPQARVQRISSRSTKMA
jgi:hypothetical protein